MSDKKVSSRPSKSFPEPQTPPPPGRPQMYRVYSDPFYHLRSLPKIKAQCSRFGNVAGPFIAPHIEHELKYGLTSIGSGFPRGSSQDSIIYQKKRDIHDVESFADLFDVSEKMKSLLERYCPSCVDFAPLKVTLRDKSGQNYEAGPRWLCDVTRFEKAVDEEALMPLFSGMSPHLYAGVGPMLFKADLPKDAHLFRLWRGPDVIVCSQQLRDAMKAEKITGVVLEPIESKNPELPL